LEEAVKELVASVKNEFDHVDILVNNAGIMTRPIPRNRNGDRQLFFPGYLTLPFP
jgi:NADP-dependent 3-hydroxy acid dehydrogenase YdfG